MPAYFYRNLIKQLTHTSITEKNPKKLKNCMMPTPIQNLLIQQKLWRFLGLVSTPVGLLCFALSTSFKQLFGEWNFSKIFVYSVVSSIICSLMLFAHKFQPSWSLLLKAQVGFLAFMLTSYYSFLYGQKANGKPDICSLVSSGSFALMSLSLSRQIHLGFEVDMFNFFLGYLLVQLMTIHLMLAFVGAVFCYLLMYLRSYLDSQAQNGTVISPVDQVALQIDGPSRVQVESGSEFNKKQLYVILGIEDRKEERVIFPTNMEAKIKELSCTGFVEECSHVYLTWRRQILDEKMLKIGLHKLDIKEIKNVPLDYIDKKIQRWIMASDYVLRVLLPDERNISNSVFLGCSPYADLCFIDLCKGSMTQLLNFANVVATGTGSPVRLFRIIKMFEALRDLLPDIKSLFYDEYSVVLRDEAITIWERLRDAIKGVFMDLEYLISQKKEPSIGVVPGGGIHPITHYVMNYLCSACQYLRTLEQVFENHHGRISTSSPLFFQFDRIVELLEKNLAAKSEMYKDPALCFVFMMNNTRYIIKSAKHSKLRELLGDNWIQNQIAQFHQCLVNYYESSWDQVIGMLYLDDESLASSSLVVESFKQKLSMFILQFERICEVQSTWVIFDENARERIKSSVERTLLTEYENFTARFQNVMETQDNNVCSDFGFGVQDIVAGIGKVFQVTDELKKHRKMQPTWTVVLPNIEDFHECWWKSSQDTFLDSSYPIYYYSCVHKLDQGCQATVQVQQIQENPPMYGTKYTGLHTCRLHANVPQMLTED